MNQNHRRNLVLHGQPSPGSPGRKKPTSSLWSRKRRKRTSQLRPTRRSSAWKCPQCGESVPGTFDVCWKCLTTKDGEKAEESEPEFFQEDPDASKPDEEPEPNELDAEPLGVEENEEETPPLSACPRCGSAKMMFGVTVCDQGEYSGGTLQVVISGDPSALIFKDRLVRGTQGQHLRRLRPRRATSGESERVVQALPEILRIDVLHRC